MPAAWPSGFITSGDSFVCTPTPRSPTRSLSLLAFALSLPCVLRFVTGSLSLSRPISVPQPSTPEGPFSHDVQPKTPPHGCDQDSRGMRPIAILLQLEGAQTCCMDDFTGMLKRCHFAPVRSDAKIRKQRQTIWAIVLLLDPHGRQSVLFSRR